LFNNWQVSWESNPWINPQPAGSSPYTELEAQVSSDLVTWTNVYAGGSPGSSNHSQIMGSQYEDWWVRARTIRVVDQNGLYADGPESFSEAVKLIPPPDPTSTITPTPLNTPVVDATPTPTPTRRPFLWVYRDGQLWRTLTK